MVFSVNDKKRNLFNFRTEIKECIPSKLTLYLNNGSIKKKMIIFKCYIKLMNHHFSQIYHGKQYYVRLCLK